MSDLLSIEIDQLLVPTGTPSPLEVSVGKVPARNGSGRPPQALIAEYSRDITDEDLTLVLTQPSLDTQVESKNRIKKLRESHHWVARLLAHGCSTAEAMIITGMSDSRINQLQTNPAFQDLLAAYRVRVAAGEDLGMGFQLNQVDRLKSVVADATQELHDRLEEDPESFSNQFLVHTIEKLGDRSGLAPTQRTENINLNISGDTIDAVKAAIDSRAKGKIIDGKATEIKQDDSGTTVGAAG